jgi:ORF6N domain-containing protein
MLSTNLARLYEVEPRALVQAIKRNIARFPEDFMFLLDGKEFHALESQIVISSWWRDASRDLICLHRAGSGDAFDAQILRSVPDPP